MGGAKKGKKGKKGKKAKKEAVPLDPHEVERKALIEEAKRLQRLKEREEIQFNEFQQQKEKLNYFWIVEKKNLEDKKAELRNKERELQDLEEKHQVEIKVRLLSMPTAMMTIAIGWQGVMLCVVWRGGCRLFELGAGTCAAVPPAPARLCRPW